MDSVNHKAVNILGPKGVGKSTALEELSRTRPDSVYIDLASSHLCAPPSASSWLLLDNAQCCTEELKPLIQKYRTIIAAFSPGADIEDQVSLVSKAGRSIKFYWRPFTLQETIELCLNLTMNSLNVNVLTSTNDVLATPDTSNTLQHLVWTRP